MAEASMTGRYRIPFHVRPMLATLVAEAFDKPGWVFEEKYDAFPKTSGSRGLPGSRGFQFGKLRAAI
jgi:hypothetical protein